MFKSFWLVNTQCITRTFTWDLKKMSTVHMPELRWLHLEVQVKAAVPAFQKSIISSHQGFCFLVDHETLRFSNASQTYGTSIIPLKRYIFTYSWFLKKLKFNSTNECSVYSLLKICRKSFCPLLTSPKKVCLTSWFCCSPSDNIPKHTNEVQKYNFLWDF